MKIVPFSILLAASAVLACTAHAQTPSDPPVSSGSASYPPVVVPQADPGWSGNPVMPCCDMTEARGVRSFDQGVAALEANDFARAEEIFADILRYNRNDATVRFYLGVAKMNLDKWDEAKRYLKIAARKLRKLPDPKGHLGVAYAKLGDTAGAYAQRAALVKMSKACKDRCRLSPYIMDGIQMIDEALAETPMAKPATQG